MATVSKPVQLKSGRWRVRWIDANGKRRSLTHDSHYDAKAALAKAHTLPTCALAMRSSASCRQRTTRG